MRARRLAAVAVAALLALFVLPGTAHAAVNAGWYGSAPYSSYSVCHNGIPVATGSDGAWLYMAVCIRTTGGTGWGTPASSQQIVVFANRSRSSFTVSPQGLRQVGYRNEPDGFNPIVSNIHSGTALCVNRTVAAGQSQWCAGPNTTWTGQVGDYQYHVFGTVNAYVNGHLLMSDNMGWCGDLAPGSVEDCPGGVRWS
jgi:hypothetical protein